MRHALGSDAQHVRAYHGAEQGGHHDEPALLAACYRASLAAADGVGAEMIAFPAISTGVYGYPRSPAATVAVDTLRSASTAVTAALLVAFDAETRDLYDTLLDR